jgi:hypothetical protein
VQESSAGLRYDYEAKIAQKLSHFFDSKKDKGKVDNCGTIWRLVTCLLSYS